MTPIAPIAPTAVPSLTLLAPLPAPAAPSGPGFADVLRAGIGLLEAKLDTADTLVRRFALGESVPMHQVTFALEEARLSMELAMQVRGRLLDGYRELMGMQL